MSGVRRARSRRFLALGLGGAFFGHAVGIAVVNGVLEPERRLHVATAPAASPEETPVDLGEMTPATVIALDGIDLSGALLSPVPGAGDAAGWGASPLPSASADLPGATAADRGGGAEGGAVTWTGRRDPDQTALRAQLWNGATVYRTPREDRDRRAATSEAIARAPEKHWGDRQVRQVARDGAEVATVTGIAAIADADPVFDRGSKETAPARKDGATRAASDAAMVDHGATAVDTPRHGRTGDDVAVAAASNERDPDPFDLTPSRSGGDDGEGVRGSRADDGALADGRGRGSGASRSGSEKGTGNEPVFASRTDPYLRELLRRLDKEIVFPKDLALDLRSGRVIAVMTVAADGTIGAIDLSRSSGFDGFDRELVRALGALRKLGAVPDDLLDGASALRVMVPYTFRNPMIK